MTDAVLTVRLGVLVVLAVVVGVRGQIRALGSIGDDRPRPPARATMLVLGLTGVAAAVIGTALAPVAGLTAPLLGARLGELAPSVVVASAGAGIAGGAVAALALPVYHRLAPRIDPALFRAADAVRVGMGLPARIALGGVFEEVVFRWGLLALVAWTAVKLGLPVSGAGRVAVVTAALAFAAAHLPGARRLSGAPLSVAGVALGFAVNGWLGLIAGWLVLRRGPASAMIAHAAVHAIWVGSEGRAR